MKDPITLILEVASVLDNLEIKYLIGGSVASSLQGFPRATNDADVVVAISGQQIPALFDALKSNFYINELAMRRAVQTKRSFNAIHFEALFKFDFYVASNEPFFDTELSRRQLMTLRPETAQQVFISSPEDTILAKLNWYKKGAETSDRQWSDVVGVIKVQKTQLDLSYLHDWAEKLAVGDLLLKALNDAEV
jgi:hypothetical protein